MPSNDEIMANQMRQFDLNNSLIAMEYCNLLAKRLDGSMSRDEYMVYDMMDMMIHLVAVIQEANKEKPYPDYMVEKLEKIESYVSTTLEYFKARGDK